MKRETSRIEKGRASLGGEIPLYMDHDAVSFSALLFQAVSDVGLWITKIRQPLSLTQKGITLKDTEISGTKERYNRAPWDRESELGSEATPCMSLPPFPTLIWPPLPTPPNLPH